MAATSTATTIVQPTFPTASLYVGDLAPDVTETILFETFNKIGTVVSVRVCRDNITKRSLGYAYVNYLQQPDAERALETLNNSLIKNRPCRIMWSQRDPSIRKSGKANIYIKNLEKKITHKELYDTFVQFGSITSCKIALDEKNESKGFGFIQFVNPESADAAINQVNGMLIEGKKVFVGHFVPQKDRQISATTRKFTNMYVKDLPATISSDAKLKELFAPFGEVLSAVLMLDGQNKPKGFGFVNVATPEQAIAAVDGLNGKKLEGAEKPLYVSRAQKKAERQYELKNKFEQMKMEQSTKYQGVNLYVKNLEDDMNSDKLRQLFAPFGNISNAVVMEDEVTHASKGFGFVCFSTPEEATKAVTEMNSKMVGNKPLYVSLAQRKDIRKAQLEAQFAQRKQMQAQARLGGPGAPMYNPQLLGPQHPMAPTGQFPNFPFANPNAALVPNSFANSGANANANAASYPGWVNQNQGGRGRGGYGYPMPGYGMPYPYPNPNMATNPNNALNNNNSGLNNNNNNNNNALNNANAMGGMNPNANRGKARGGMGGPNNMGRGGVKRSFPPNNMNPMNNMNMNSMNPSNPNPNPNANVGAQNMPPPAVTVVTSPQTNAAVEAPLTLQTLQAYSPDDQKRLLGDQLYPRIELINAENAGKITGMILEGSTNEEMLSMLANDSALLNKVQEALEVLKSS